MELKTQLLFIHINKTAGRAIKTALKINWMDCPHRTLEDWRTLLGKRFEEYYIFSFVRHPQDRLVSMYLNKLKGFRRRAHIIAPFETYVEEMCGVRRINPVRGSTVPDKGVPKTLAQFDWLSLDGQLGTHFLGKYEKLDEDFAKLTRTLGFKWNKRLNHIGGTKRDKKDWREYYDKRLADMVYDAYLRDFETFNYKPDYGNPTSTTT